MTKMKKYNKIKDVRVKNCPFCKGKADMQYENGLVFIECLHCHARGPRREQNELHAEIIVLTDWNYRGVGEKKYVVNKEI